MLDPEQIPLRELHFPEAIGWWPLAPGWWLLIALALLALAVLLRRWLRSYSRGAARRHALRRLDEIVQAYSVHRDIVTFAADVSELLRRTMLAYAPRSDIAGLTGEAWLAWLDRDLAQPVFASGPGRQLLHLPYTNPQAAHDGVDFPRLVSAVRHRLATPVGVPR